MVHRWASPALGLVACALVALPASSQVPDQRAEGGHRRGVLGQNQPNPFSQQTTIPDRKSTRLNSSHPVNSYAVFCLKKKKQHRQRSGPSQRVEPRPALQAAFAPAARSRPLRAIAALARPPCVLTAHRAAPPLLS